MLALFSSTFILSLLSLKNSEVKRWDINESDDSYEYKHLDYDPSRNETSRGYVSINQHLETDEYIFYRNKGSYALISNFGFETNEYKCSGSCHCDDDLHSRRRTSALISGVVYLLVAASNLIAIKIAKEYYEKECTSLLLQSEESCSSSIKSEVDSCEEIISQEAISSSKNEDEEEEEESKIKYKITGTYWCRGNCLNSMEYKNVKRVQTRLKEINCDKMSAETGIVVDCSDAGVYGGLYSIEQVCVLQAAREFRESTLFEFCREMSFWNLNTQPEDMDDSSKDWNGKYNQISLCVDHWGGFNPTVKCLPLHQEKIRILKEYEKKIQKQA